MTIRFVPHPAPEVEPEESYSPDVVKDEERYTPDVVDDEEEYTPDVSEDEESHTPEEHEEICPPDVLLISKDGGSQEVHSGLLAEYSKYLRRCFEFSVSNPPGTAHLITNASILKDNGPWRVKTNFSLRSIKYLVEFLYTGEVQLPRYQPPGLFFPYGRQYSSLYDQRQRREEHAFNIFSILVEVHNLALCYHVDQLRIAAEERITRVLADCTGKMDLFRGAACILENGIDETNKALATVHVIKMLHLYSSNKRFPHFMWTRAWCTALKRMPREAAQEYYNLLAGYIRLNDSEPAKEAMESLPMHYNWVMSFRSHQSL
ncbi:hypothetical protein P168DRAFT_322591 [Aspergillus campestris IBT 28561]|uniref:BTB domain-containing protein n=1 Tax=Aspergillus campestris (strain IBT 28561) TaxID=1392248 RepID=A0A2I1CR76_ASPC2|nr:uncharacterized protein P168DRAFT_322591 [Aspergillus campestris IBT 28561]PKY00141.1 hypothetical protein P168DRAFT_322591 [Aspergillus campestris IBT 28561]